MTNETQPVIWNEYVNENNHKDIEVSMFYKVGEPGLVCNISITEKINSTIIYPLLQILKEKIQSNKQEFEGLPESEKNTMGKGYYLAIYTTGLNQLFQLITKEKERLDMLIRRESDIQNNRTIKSDR